MTCSWNLCCYIIIYKMDVSYFFCHSNFQHYCSIGICLYLLIWYLKWGFIFTSLVILNHYFIVDLVVVIGFYSIFLYDVVDRVQPKTSPFSMRISFYWAKKLYINFLSQFFIVFWYLNSARHNLVIEFCCAIKNIFFVNAYFVNWRAVL